MKELSIEELVDLALKEVEELEVEEQVITPLCMDWQVDGLDIPEKSKALIKEEIVRALEVTENNLNTYKISNGLTEREVGVLKENIIRISKGEHSGNNPKGEYFLTDSPGILKKNTMYLYDEDAVKEKEVILYGFNLKHLSELENRKFYSEDSKFSFNIMYGRAENGPILTKYYENQEYKIPGTINKEGKTNLFS